MNVFVACEESQVVALAFRKLGHNAFSCDLQPCSGGHPEFHIFGDCLDYLIPGCFKTLDGSNHFVESWDLMIAHPPCTYLSNAGACRLYGNGFSEDRYLLGVAAASFFMKLFNAPINRICIENPVPMKIFNLPPYSQIIDPSYFGHPYNKRTCLWLKNLPPLFASCFVDRTSSWVFQSRSPFLRSKTFPGVAAAMAAQWSFS